MVDHTHHWGLWRSNTKTLRQDSSIVRGARTVPQQLAIVQLLEGTVPLVLSLSDNFEDLTDRKKKIRQYMYDHNRINGKHNIMFQMNDLLLALPVCKCCV